MNNYLEHFSDNSDSPPANDSIIWLTTFEETATSQETDDIFQLVHRQQKMSMPSKLTLLVPSIYSEATTDTLRYRIA